MMGQRASPPRAVGYMKSVLLCCLALVFVLLLTSCGDDPVSSSGTGMTPTYHGDLLALDTWFGRVVGVAPNDVYAIGSVLLHYDGSAWAPVALPNDPRTLRSAVAFADGTFAISDGDAIFLHDKSTWTRINGPAHSVENLWGPSKTDLYGIGYEGIDHFDGAAWTPVVLPGRTEWPFVMAGRSSNDIVTTGRYGAIYRFDGAQWFTASVDSFYGYSSLAMTQSGTVFAADARCVFEFTESTRKLILDNVLDDAILCADDEVIYAAGSVRYQFEKPEFVVARYAGGEWQTVARDSGVPSDFWASNGNLVVAGRESMIWRGTDQGGHLDNTYPRRKTVNCAIAIDDAIYAAGRGAYRYQGGVWTDLNKEYISENTAWAIAGRTRHDVYAVGSAMIMHFNGEKWDWINGGFGQDLDAAWVDANDDLLVAGRRNIFRMHHGEWSDEAIPHDPRWIYAMWGSDRAVYAVGSDGLIAVRRDGQWSSMASGTSSDLFTIWGFDDNHVYAAGSNNNELCVYDGRTWLPVPITTADLENFRSIWGNSPSDFWAADFRGIVAHYDGRRWTQLERIFPGGLQVLCGNGRETIAFMNNGMVSYHR